MLAELPCEHVPRTASITLRIRHFFTFRTDLKKTRALTFFEKHLARMRAHNFKFLTENFWTNLKLINELSVCTPFK